MSTAIRSTTSSTVTMSSSSSSATMTISSSTTSARVAANLLVNFSRHKFDFSLHRDVCTRLPGHLLALLDRLLDRLLLGHVLTVLSGHLAALSAGHLSDREMYQH